MEAVLPPTTFNTMYAHKCCAQSTEYKKRINYLRVFLFDNLLSLYDKHFKKIIYYEISNSENEILLTLYLQMCS